MKIPKPAVILLSGGLDSAVTLAIAKSKNFTPHALTFDYGQRHRVELHAARRVAKHLAVASHRFIKIDLRALGHSALTDQIPVPKDRDKKTIARDIPVTYVPARNTIFLAYALAAAEVLQSSDLFIGVNAVDYSGYPDCRPQYIHAFQRLANLATRAAVQGRKLSLHTPLIHWSKTRIINTGLKLNVDFSLTHSCYDPSPPGIPCLRCDACKLRQDAFAELGIPDPAIQ